MQVEEFNDAIGIATVAGASRYAGSSGAARRARRRARPRRGAASAGVVPGPGARLRETRGVGAGFDDRAVVGEAVDDGALLVGDVQEPRQSR